MLMPSGVSCRCAPGSVPRPGTLSKFSRSGDTADLVAAESSVTDRGGADAARSIRCRDWLAETSVVRLPELFDLTILQVPSVLAKNYLNNQSIIQAILTPARAPFEVQDWRSLVGGCSFGMQLHTVVERFGTLAPQLGREFVISSLAPSLARWRAISGCPPKRLTAWQASSTSCATSAAA